MRELSEYEIQQSKMVGIDADSNKEIELPMEEILFAFPASAMSSLQPYLNNIQNDVKNQRLTSVPKEEALQVMNWLQYFNNIQNDVKNQRLTSVPKGDGSQVMDWLQSKVKCGNIDSKYWVLPNIDATVVTRVGHVLRGVLKSFTNEAIYMQINDQLVTVYMHGLYKLNTPTDVKHSTREHPRLLNLAKQLQVDIRVITCAGHVLQGKVEALDPSKVRMQIEGQTVIISRHDLAYVNLITFGDSMLEREPFKFITYEDPIELSYINKTEQYKLTGVDKSGNRSGPIDMFNILFAYSVKSIPDVEPIQINTQVEQQKLKPIQKGDKLFKIQTSYFNSAKLEKLRVRILTRRGHVLEGTIEHFDRFEIHLKINGQTVIVYRRALYDVSTKVKDIVNDYGNEEN